jgi:uncharacterized protein (TIGR03083 family)
VLHDPAQVRAAFHEATEAFVETVAAIGPEHLDAPGLGEWTVVELLAHTCRAFTTMASYVATAPRPDAPTIDTAADYYRLALGTNPDVHADVAARARADVASLGPDPVLGALELARHGLAVLHRTPDEHPCATFVGTMRFAAYLPTRLVEVVVHTRDLQRATGQLRPIPPVARTVVLQVLRELTERVADPDALVDVLTGRDGAGALNVLA